AAQVAAERVANEGNDARYLLELLRPVRPCPRQLHPLLRHRRRELLPSGRLVVAEYLDEARVLVAESGRQQRLTVADEPGVERAIKRVRARGGERIGQVDDILPRLLHVSEVACDRNRKLRVRPLEQLDEVLVMDGVADRLHDVATGEEAEEQLRYRWRRRR